MFHFDFLLYSEVWKQYLVMIVGAFIFGGVLGLIYGNTRIRGLKAKLLKLDRDLVAWQKQLHDTEQVAVSGNSNSYREPE